MASAFAHAAAGAALWPLLRPAHAPRSAWVVGAALAVFPDIDVIGFRFGVAYGDLLGHRGLTHSLLVAIVAGGVIAFLWTRDGYALGDRLALAAYLIGALASHGLLDAMTTGGLGVALLAPIDNTRYFFPWRPIAVSPIGIRPFFTARGLAVLANECVWVGLPTFALVLIGVAIRRRAPRGRPLSEPLGMTEDR
jgi:inner membrane protein